ncbi:MAG: hypothetical protein P8Y48_17740, partial [Novosphingobium sp.]
MDPTAASEECGGSPCAKLDRRYSLSKFEDDQPFEENDVYSINIEQMMIGNNISEGGIFKYFDKNGEFAVLANVFEFSSSEGSGEERKFYNGDINKSKDVPLKLIYFDDGVQAYQSLNFSNIVLQPRTVYHGGSIGIQIVVMELDTQEGSMTKLLTTLAGYGKNAIPASSETSDILLELGKSLFNGGSYDDRLFAYEFVLSNGSIATDSGTRATFTPGRYALRRSEMRADPMKWEGVLLNNETGRLVDKEGNEIRKDLYFILNIAKYDENVRPEFYQFDKWREFRDTLEEQDLTATTLANLTKEIGEKLAEKRSEDWYHRTAKRWAEAENKLNRYSRNAYRNFEENNFLVRDIVKSCEYLKDNRAKRLIRFRDISERNARDSISEFITDYQIAINKEEEEF